MKLIKDIVFKKYKQFFINLKNNQFNPELFYDAVSLSNAYLGNYFKVRLSIEDIEKRQLILEGIAWDALEESFSFSERFENKTELNSLVKSNYSTNSKEFVSMLTGYIEEDEKLINSILKKFEVKFEPKKTEKSFSDIKNKWSIGVIKENV